MLLTTCSRFFINYFLIGYTSSNLVTVFVVHGGIGPSTAHMTLADLDRLDRFKEPSFDDDEEEEFIEGASTDIASSSEGTAAVVKEKEYCPAGMSELLWSGETCQARTRLSANLCETSITS